jgi:hypothetical protein
LASILSARVLVKMKGWGDDSSSSLRVSGLKTVRAIWKDARFDALAEEFAERYRRGERPSLQVYVDRLAEMADEVREMFPAPVDEPPAPPVRLL